VLEVQDWGIGFLPEEKLRETERVGLHGMAERVSLIGGSYTLQSAPGEGTCVQALFPAIKPIGEEFGG
jgi:signal transduction histidine kinase